MSRRTILCVMLGAALAAATACDAKTTSESAQQTSKSAQQLRTCVDRWNQANMVGWGPAFVRVAVRRLDATELGAVGLRDPARARCVISFAFESRADPQTGCSGRTPVPGKPGWCLDRKGTFACAINPLGAYNCPLIHEPLGPRLTEKNATTDKRGVLKLDASLKGTHATPRLAWQRYPHTDGWVEPWTRTGDLRRGLKLGAGGHGPCFMGSEKTHAKSAMTCRRPCRGGSQLPVDRKATLACNSPAVGRFEPCFPSRRDWRRGDLAACAKGPGDTTFMRWTISGRL
jgi:hypothetical protein